ncbi:MULTISPECIES: PQQ-binding-like beta-propeller repeat protein [unclassified Streptomyces]|uniref:outer membrane protein assembly factor BamB family protein n=1 Tax=unclassified Streptomyces TaxID=2593676 RepID=UPI0033A9765E
MTTESSPGQGVPQEEPGWAFRPRTAAGNPQPYGEQQQTRPAAPWDGRPSAEQYGESSGTRWEYTVPLRVPEPGAGTHDAMRGPGRGMPPHTLRGGEPADPGSGYPSPATAVLDQTVLRRPESAAAQPQPPARGGAERTGKTGRVGRIVLTLAVLAGVGGAAVVMLKQQDASAVASRNLTQEWQLPAPSAGDTLIGSWLTDKLLVRAGSRGGLRAYDVTDGKQVWSAASVAGASKRGTVPCAMSPTLNARGIGTVAFGKGGSTCTWLAGVKASTGKILWSMPLTNAKHPAAAIASTYLKGNVATVVSQNFLGGVDVRTGTRVWGYKARGHYCNAYNWGTDGAVLVDDFCLDQKTRFTLTAYDGRTGKVIWRKPESAHSDVTHFLSGSPLIAAVHTARQDAVRVFGTTGTGRKLAVGDDELTSGNSTGADHSARLYGKVLVTPASTAGSTVIDGFDTTTGAKLWTHHSAALAVPASGADDKVYAVTTSGSPQLISIDPRTGRSTPVAGLPTGTGKWNFTSGTVYVTSDGGVLELNAIGSNGGVRLYR